MTLKHITMTCFVWAASMAPAAPQFQVPDWENSVAFQLVASQEPVRPGDEFKIALVAEIQEGYHLYGPEEAYPSATEVSVSGDGIEAGDPSYPAVEKRELSGLGTYDLYEGTIAISVPVTMLKDASGERHEIVATVNYQVCTDYACSAPTSDEIKLELTAGPVGAAVTTKHPEIFKPE